MNRGQSNKVKARAALAALLSLAVFGICVTGVVAGERYRDKLRNGQSEEARRAAQRLENELPALAPDGTPPRWEKTQRALHDLLQRDHTIRAAVVVGRDYVIHAGLPARADLVGQPLGVDIMRSGSWPGSAGSEERLRQRVRDVLAEAPGIGSAAYEASMVRHSLTGADGDRVGWLFVLLPPQEHRGEGPEPLVPLLGIGALVSFALYWFMLPLWVFLDARPRTNKAIPLTLFVFLTNFLGWLTYLVIRPESDRLCAACDTPMEPGFRLCPMCGWSGALRCHQCGRPCRPDWRFCPHCETARPDADLVGAELARFGR
jgi:hypothetical protein